MFLGNLFLNAITIAGRSCNPALWPKTGCEAVKEEHGGRTSLFEVGSGDRALDRIEGLAPFLVLVSRIALEKVDQLHNNMDHG